MSVPNITNQISISLNYKQKQAIKALNKFIMGKYPNILHSFLLLGPGRSGKTTVILNMFQQSDKNLAFCAFTNKATQVLKNMANKYNIQFSAHFATIHKLFGLPLDDLIISYSDKMIEQIRQYDIIIFDECSIIPSYIYNHIEQIWQIIKNRYEKELKFIFLGDYWQLPPINEDHGIVFAKAIQQNWPVIKLFKIMRSKHEKIEKIHNNLFNLINQFQNNRNQIIQNFLVQYPYNIISPQIAEIYPSYDKFISKYMNYLTQNNTKTQTNKVHLYTQNSIILTYTNTNRQKINTSIQNIINARYDRPMINEIQPIIFYPGDRCCIEQPIELFAIREKSNYIMLGESLDQYLYNGEIFIVQNVIKTRVKTDINKYKYIPSYFNCQLLTIQKIHNTHLNRDQQVLDLPTYKIIHIDSNEYYKACNIIKYKNTPELYQTIIGSHNHKYPILSYGYCITIHKSQGSEWDHVFINLCSIKHSINSSELTFKKNKKFI